MLELVLKKKVNLIFSITYYPLYDLELVLFKRGYPNSYQTYKMQQSQKCI